MKPKHSKYKNTGILFELLTRQITSETISNTPPKAVGILRKFFGKNTALLKEYQIYHALLNKKFNKEASANVLIETLTSAHSKLNKSVLRRERYNLVKEIKDTYNIEDFFKAKIPNYKIYASVFNLLENKSASPMSIVDSKVAILEHITNKTYTLYDEIYNMYKIIRHPYESQRYYMEEYEIIDDMLTFILLDNGVNETKIDELNINQKLKLYMKL